MAEEDECCTHYGLDKVRDEFEVDKVMALRAIVILPHALLAVRTGSFDDTLNVSWFEHYPIAITTSFRCEF